MNIDNHIEEASTFLNALKVDSLVANPAAPADKKMLAKARKEFPKLPKTLLDFYSKHDGLHFEWFYEKKEVYAGKIMLSSIDFLLGGRTGEWDEHAFEDIIWSEDDDEEEQELRKNLKMLNNDSSQQIFTLIDLSSSKTPLYLLQGSKLFPLSLGIDEYIDTAFQFLGMTYWQHLFTPEGRKGKSNLGNQCLTQLKAILPKQQFEEISKRIKK